MHYLFMALLILVSAHSPSSVLAAQTQAKSNRNRPMARLWRLLRFNKARPPLRPRRNPRPPPLKQALANECRFAAPR